MTSVKIEFASVVDKCKSLANRLSRVSRLAILLVVRSFSKLLENE